MLKRHRSIRADRTVSGKPDAPAPQFRIAASALTLPALEGIPAKFSVKSSAPNAINEAAHALVDAGRLTSKHWSLAKGDSRQAIALSLADVAYTARPQPLARLDVVLVDDTAKADLEYDHNCNEEYNHRYKVKAGKLGAIVVRCVTAEDGPYHAVIGTRLAQLEAARPGLGHAVLHWLHEALDKSSRGCDPIDGFGWAQGNYWMGEMDETQTLEEQMDEAESFHNSQQAELPKKERKEFDHDEARDQIEIFTRAEFDEAIPKWAGSEHNGFRKVLKPAQLARLRFPGRSSEAIRFKKIIAATLACCAAVKGTPHLAEMTDIVCFEQLRYEICPFLLRWKWSQSSDQDPLGQIWDDYMNQEFEHGETNMTVNAAFAFHDAASLAHAVKRFERYCRILQTAENLIRELKSKEI